MTCKQASEFLSRKDELNLSFLQRLKLRVHLLGCDICGLFSKQIHAISENFTHECDNDNCLTEDDKQRMNVALSEIRIIKN